MFDPGEYIRQIATHYPDSDSIRRVLGFAEVDLLHIDIEGKPLNIWFDALREVQQQGRLEKFLEIIGTEYSALQIEQDHISTLEVFLEREPVTDKEKKKISFPYLLMGISVILFVFLLILFAGRNDKDIIIRMYGKGNASSVVTSGKLTISSLSGNQSKNLSVDEKGMVIIKQTEPWMQREKIRLQFAGTVEDTLSLFRIDTVIQLKAGDTTRIEVKVEKKNILPVYTFIRLAYNNNNFEFPADASVLLLKKYIMSLFDSKTGLPADRQMLFYAGKEWTNDVQLNDIPWNEDRNVVLKYRLSTTTESSSVTIHMKGIDTKGGIAFLDQEPGEIMNQTGSNTVLKFPKVIGASELKVFFKDSLLVMPHTTGDSDSEKFYNRFEFEKYLLPIQRKVK